MNILKQIQLCFMLVICLVESSILLRGFCINCRKEVKPGRYTLKAASNGLYVKAIPGGPSWLGGIPGGTHFAMVHLPHPWSP